MMLGQEYFYSSSSQFSLFQPSSYLLACHGR